MPVPTTRDDLNVTASLNSPAGSEAIGTSLDNYIRSHSAIIKQYVNDIADGTSASKGSGLVGFLPYGTGAQGTTLQQYIGKGLPVSVFGFFTQAQIDDVRNRALTLDLSTAIQAAADYCKGFGARLWFPAGSYRFSNVTIEDCLVEGEGVGEQDSPLSEGTVFSITSTTNPAFIMKRGACFKGVTFYYPNQVTSGAPTVYPPTLQGFAADTVTNVWIEDVVAINSYIFARYGDAAKTSNHGRLTIRNSTIYGIYRSIEAYSLLDVLQISDCIFTWGPLDAIAAGQTLKNWTAANGDCIYADRLDGLQVSNTIIYGPNKALHVNTALADLWVFSNVLFDATLYALYAEGASDLANTSFASCNFNCFQTGDATAAGSAIFINASGSSGTELSFASCQFSLTRGNFIDIQNSTLKSLIVTGSQFGALGTATGAAGSKYAISVNDTDCLVTVGDVQMVPGAYASSVGISVTNAKCLTAQGATIDGANIPFNLSAVSDSAVVSGCTTRNTSGSTSVSIGAGAQQKTLFGVNHFDKPSITSVGAPKFMAVLSGTTTVNSGTDTTIAFGSELIDTTASYDTGTSTFTAPITGVYRFSYRLTHDSTIAATDRWLVKIKTTARDYSQLYRAPAADVLTVVGGCIAHMTAGDTAKITVARSGGSGNFVTQLDGNLTEFSGELVL